MSKRKNNTDPPDDEDFGGLTIPETHIKALDLHRDDFRFQAIYFSPSGTAVVTNGRTYRLVPASQSAGFHRWLGRQGICLGVDTAWLVLDSVNRVGFAFGAEAAHATVVAQWGGKSMPMEQFLEQVGHGQDVSSRESHGDAEPREL